MAKHDDYNCDLKTVHVKSKTLKFLNEDLNH